MSIEDGRNGLVQIGSTPLGHLKKWDVNGTAEKRDVTEMGSDNRMWEGGLIDGEVKFECFWDAVDAAQGDIRVALGDKLTVNVYPNGDTSSGASYYTGLILFTGVDVSGSVDDTVSGGFSGSGTMVLGAVA